MSKIPVAKGGGFRSSASNSKSVLREQNRQENPDRMWEKSNFESSDGLHTPSSSTISPLKRPTEEEIAAYEASLQLRHVARDARVALRKSQSPATEEYYTPQREMEFSGISGLSENFETPMSSDSRLFSTTASTSTFNKSETTPKSKKPELAEQKQKTLCLSRRMEQNFTHMQNMIFSGKSVLDARNEALGSSRMSRSSSQPPPIDFFNTFSSSGKTGKRPVSREPSPNIRLAVSSSYVDSLVTAHQLHSRYADTANSIEKQMSKAESLAKLAKASEPIRRLKSDSMMARKREKIEKIKDSLQKVNFVLEATHKIRFKDQFEISPEDAHLLRSLDGWLHLEPQIFQKKYEKQMTELLNRLRAARQRFVEKKEEKLREQQKKRRRRSSSAQKIVITPDAPRPENSEQAAAPRSISPPLAPRLGYKERQDAGTQVSARKTIDEGTQMSERQIHGVERLDLSALGAHSEPSELEKVLSSIELHHNTSLETVFPAEHHEEPILNTSQESRTHLMMDIKFPTTPEITPRSGRPSLISETSSRLSEGLKFALERALNPNLSRSDEPPMEILVEEREQEEPNVEQIEQNEQIVENEHQNEQNVQFEQNEQNVHNEQQNGHIEQQNEQNVQNVLIGQNEPKPEESSSSDDQKPLPEIKIISPTSSSDTPSWSLSSFRDPEEHPEELKNPEELKQELAELDEDFDPDATQFEHEKEEKEEARRILSTPDDDVLIDLEPVELQNAPKTPLAIEEEEDDETKTFRSRDEFEGAELELENQDTEEDDSMFLLDAPLIRPKSILDGALRADTPREMQNVGADISLDTSLDKMELEEYCHGDFLVEISPIVINKALELQEQLRGVDWAQAHSVWQPPKFADFQLDIYDQFDIFDSFSALVWGSVVDLLNRKFLKFGGKLTAQQEVKFAAEARELITREFGASSLEKEWCSEVKLSAKLEGMMPLELDHRFDVRKMASEEQKQTYQWQQIQMAVIDERFGRKELEEQLEVVYQREKSKLEERIAEEIVEELKTE